MAKKKNKIYAVAIGRTADGEMVYGKTYPTWTECEAVTAGVPGAIYKSFEDGLLAASWLFTVLKANGISNDEVEYSLNALKTSAKASAKVAASPIKLNTPKPFENTIPDVYIDSTPPEPSSSPAPSCPTPVGDLKVSPLLQWKPEALPETVSDDAVDIQFDIVCCRFGLKPGEVMNHLKRQFLETFGLMEKQKTN